MNIYILILANLLFVTTSFYAQESLENIEREIHETFDKSIDSKTDEFSPLIEKLDAVSRNEQNNILNYWFAYLKYRQAIFFMSQDNDEQAMNAINTAISRLKTIKKPTSEDLTLHGSLLGLSISFQPELAAITSGKASTLYDKALKLDDNNLRTYLAIARSDYYKPAKYGGGLKVESYLKKALTKPDKSSDELLAPSWGRDQIYYYLVSFYLREGKLNDAKFYCIKGLKIYPNSKTLQYLKNKLEQ